VNILNWPSWAADKGWSFRLGLGRGANDLPPLELTTLRYISQRQTEHVTCSGDRRRGNRILARKTEGKRPLGRPRRRRQDDTKMDLKEMETWTELIWFWIGRVGGLL
jgi:hypothetical protein